MTLCKGPEPHGKTKIELRRDSLRDLALACGAGTADNVCMELLGHVRNGVVVLDGNAHLPEGAAVMVRYPGPVAGHSVGKIRIQVPLVRTGQPGSVNLTSERIAEILDEEDAAPRR